MSRADIFDDDAPISDFSPSKRGPHEDIKSGFMRKMIVSSCTKCGGRGSIDGSACECMLQLGQVCGLDRAGCPTEYWSYDLHAMFSKSEAFNGLTRKLAQAVDSYRVEHSNAALNLLFHGPYRRGKTTLAIAAMKRCMWSNDRFSGAYVTADQLILSRSKRDGGQVDFDYLGSVDLLIIDEIGKGGSADWQQIKFMEAFDILLRKRRKARATILISNFAPARIGERYGENIAIQINNDFESIDFTPMPQLGMRSNG